MRHCRTGAGDIGDSSAAACRLASQDAQLEVRFWFGDSKGSIWREALVTLVTLLLKCFNNLYFWIVLILCIFSDSIGWIRLGGSIEYELSAEHCVLTVNMNSRALLSAFLQAAVLQHWSVQLLVVLNCAGGKGPRHVRLWSWRKRIICTVCVCVLVVLCVSYGLIETIPVLCLVVLWSPHSLSLLYYFIFGPRSEMLCCLPLWICVALLDILVLCSCLCRCNGHSLVPSWPGFPGWIIHAYAHWAPAGFQWALWGIVRASKLRFDHAVSGYSNNGLGAAGASILAPSLSALVALHTLGLEYVFSAWVLAYD